MADLVQVLNSSIEGSTKPGLDQSKLLEEALPAQAASKGAMYAARLGRCRSRVLYNPFHEFTCFTVTSSAIVVLPKELTMWLDGLTFPSFTLCPKISASSRKMRTFLGESFKLHLSSLERTAPHFSMASSMVSPPTQRSSRAAMQKPAVISSPRVLLITWSSSTSEFRSPWPSLVSTLIPL